MAKCKITVLKKMFNPDLAEEYRRADVHYGPCPYYEAGDEFIVEHMGERPANFFCDWAWNDLNKVLFAMQLGGDFSLYYVLDVDQGKTVWASSIAPDEELFLLLFPQGVEERTIPGFIIDSAMKVTSAPPTPLPAPTVEVIKDTVAGNVRTMHLRFSSQREAAILYAAVTNPNLTFQSVTVNGIVSAKPLNQSQLNEGNLVLPEGVSLSNVMLSRTLFYFEGLGAGEVIDLVFEVIVGEPVSLIVLDSSFGLPESSQPLLDALPLSAQLGHAETTVYTTASFENSK